MGFLVSRYKLARNGKPMNNNSRATLLGFVTKLLNTRKNIKIGAHFQADALPKITVDPKSQLIIGEGVIFRKDVEIRVHNEAKLEIGNDIRIDRGVRLLAANKSMVIIGEGSRIGCYSVFNGGDQIRIGKKCLISGFVFLQTSMHRHKKGKFIQDQGYDHDPIELGDDVWLGVHSVVLPGCSIGSGAIVGSNSVVTKNINADEIVVGAPARLINIRE
jgi:acetyltransferase-like isoleucine patch superfamily enzyme